MTANRALVMRLALLGPAIGLIVAASAFLGPIWIPAAEIFGDPPSTSFWHLRVPRTLLAAVAGAGLALGGAVFQLLFRNPLATPYTLGIASGASLAAAAGFLYQVGGYWFGVPQMVLLAFAGAIGAMLLIMALARLQGGRDMARLLLAGVCIMFMCSAGIMLVTFLSDRPVTNDTVRWLMGSLAVVRPRAAAEIAWVLGPVILFCIWSHRALDLLALGDQLAAARGVRVGVTVWGSFAAVGLLTAAIVANCGPIGFIGLMVPHFARALLGQRALPVLLGSVLIGAAFLAACDGLARSLTRYELPVGIVTNILGAGFFFALLARGAVSPHVAR